MVCVDIKSQRVQSQYIPILSDGCAFLISLILTVSLTLGILSEGFLVLLELELQPWSPDKVE